jgi:hypothetical protein
MSNFVYERIKGASAQGRLIDHDCLFVFFSSPHLCIHVV